MSSEFQWFTTQKENSLHRIFKHKTLRFHTIKYDVFPKIPLLQLDQYKNSGIQIKFSDHPQNDKEYSLKNII